MCNSLLRVLIPLTNTGGLRVSRVAELKGSDLVYLWHKITFVPDKDACSRGRERTALQ